MHVVGDSNTYQISAEDTNEWNMWLSSTSESVMNNMGNLRHPIYLEQMRTSMAPSKQSSNKIVLPCMAFLYMLYYPIQATSLSPCPMYLTPCHSSSPATGRKIKNPEGGELDACYKGINTHWRHALQILLIDQSRGFETMGVVVIRYLIGHQNASICRWNTTQYINCTTLTTWDSQKYTNTSCACLRDAKCTD